MKKIIVLAFLFILMCGCASNFLHEENLDESSKDFDKIVNTSSLEGGGISYYGSYSEGYAWIDWVSGEGLRKVSLIDKKGKIVNLKDPHEFFGKKKDKLIGIPINNIDSSGEILDFYEGYAWCALNDNYYPINNELEIVEKFHSTEDKEIKAFGGKYYLAMVKEKEDNHQEQYLAIYDCEGHAIVRTEECDPGSHSFYYLGNGIFSFATFEKAFLFTTNGILKEYPKSFHEDLLENQFSEGSTQLLLTSREENSGEGSAICIIDKDGTIQTINFKGADTQPSINSKGLALYFTYNDADNGTRGFIPISEDITKQNVKYRLDTPFSEYLSYSFPLGIEVSFDFHKNPYVFNENGIVPLSFIDSDRKDYIRIFDFEFNQIGKTIPGQAVSYFFESEEWVDGLLHEDIYKYSTGRMGYAGKYQFQDGLLVVYSSDGTVATYNEKGEKEFEFPEGTINVSLLSDGVYTVQLNPNTLFGSQGKNFISTISLSEGLISPDEVCYITKEGKRLFEEISQPE